MTTAINRVQLPAAYLDAFGRVRVSEPTTVFDSKQLIDNQPLVWDDAVISGAGTSSTYNTNQASTTLAVSNATAGVRARQTFRSLNYQPGKALAHGEPVLTPRGWVAIEEIKVGDEVFDGRGQVTKVEGVYPQGVRELYRITFDDGTHVDCDGDHLWKTIVRQNSQKGQERVLTTRQMLEEYGEEPPAFARWRIPASPVLNLEERVVPIDPYTLGAILGDGCITKSSDAVVFTSADPELVAYLKADVTKRSSKYSYGILGMPPHIRELGLSGKDAYSKFVPDCYKFNATAVRLGVLQGLMDTDGDVDKRVGTASYTSVSRQLADDVAYLVRSLGGQAKIKSRYTKYTNAEGERVQGALSYRVSVIMPECPFRLERKAFYWRPRTRVSFDRYIHTIKPLREDLATCIRVESEDHTFITRNHIVTHNSTQIFMTFVMGADAADVTRRVGQFNANNGMYFELTGSVKNFVTRTFTSGAPVNTAVAQASWNIDRLDGTGPSGYTLDLTKAQILIMDYEWLGVGIQRFGFVIDGKFLYAHQANNANELTLVYMQSPNLPLRYEIGNAGAGPVAGLTHICSTVISEGGRAEPGILRSVDRGTTPLVTLNNADLYPILAIRLKSTHVSATIEPKSISIICTSTAAYRWALILNPTVVGTALSFSPLTNSPIEADAATTNATTLTPGTGTQIISGYAQSNSEGAVNTSLSSDLSLGATIAGVSDILVLAAQRVTGTTETFYAALEWGEVG